MYRIRTYLAERGISNADFAERVGVVAHYIYEIDSGRRSPSLRVAQAIERETGGEITCMSWDTEKAASGK